MKRAAIGVSYLEMCAHACMCVHVCMCGCTDACAFMCVHVCTHTCMCVCTCVFACTCTECRMTGGQLGSWHEVGHHSPPSAVVGSQSRPPALYLSLGSPEVSKVGGSAQELD